MLKGIDPLLSGELLRHLDEAGHGETVALVDRNYPAYASGAPVVRVDTGVVRAAEAILGVLPLDDAVPPLARMAAHGNPALVLPHHARILELARRIERPTIEAEPLERFAFYERAASARVVVLTREEEAFNCFLFVKGVIPAGGPSTP